MYVFEGRIGGRDEIREAPKIIIECNNGQNK